MPKSVLTTAKRALQELSSLASTTVSHCLTHDASNPSQLFPRSNMCQIGGRIERCEMLSTMYMDGERRRRGEQPQEQL